MSKRLGDASKGDPNLARKRVRVDSVVTLDSQKDNVNRPASFPGLVSFTKSMAPQGLDDMNMRLVRKRPINTRIDDDLEEETPELIAKQANMEWRARKGFTEMNHDYFIGVRNRTTNTIQLFEVDGMYSLRPFVRRQPTREDDPKLDDDEKRRTYAEQKTELLETFGGKRSLKKVAKYEQDRITDDKVDERAAIQVTEATSEMIAKDKAQGIHHLKDDTTESMAPPHDSSAAAPECAYPLEGLITPGELAALELEASSMLESCSGATGLFENPGWNPLVWDVLIRITSDKEISNAVRIRRMQAAMHLHYLIILCGCPKKIFHATQGQLLEDMAVDDGVLKCLLERFTVPESAAGKQSGRRKSPADSTRLVVYAVVMWVTACGFKSCDKLGELADTLGVSIKLLLKHALQVGCKVRRKSDQKGPAEYRLSLKTPLVFPPIRKRQGRPQKRS